MLNRSLYDSHLDVFEQERLPIIIGHRGASGYAPENTLASFEKANALGLRWVEFDTRLAACGEVVVIHDWNLERTTNGCGEVNQIPYAELIKLDAGSWFDKNFHHQHIPSLAQVLTYLKHYNLCPNIEIKPHPGKEQEIVLAINNILQEHWSVDRPLIVSSFSIECLEIFQQINPAIALGLLLDSWSENWLETAKKLNCVAIHANQLIITAATAEIVKAHNLYLLAFTVNETARASELFSLGVDGIFSDFPDRLSYEKI